MPAHPAFHHSEIEALYRYGFDLPDEIIASILALPRKTLVADLKAVLDNSILQFEEDELEEADFDDKTSSYAFHAIRHGMHTLGR